MALPISPRRRLWPWTLAGLGAALLLHAVAGWGSLPGLAQQNGTNTTFSNSTTSSTGFESPPSCTTIGSTRQVQTFTLTETIGPRCIGVGNRDVANPSPACSGLSPAPPPVDPAFGSVFQVVAGTVNFNTNTHTLTLTCVAPTPALPAPWLGGLGAAALALGAAVLGLARRRAARSDGHDDAHA